MRRSGDADGGSVLTYSDACDGKHTHRAMWLVLSARPQHHQGSRANPEAVDTGGNCNFDNGLQHPVGEVPPVAAHHQRRVAQLRVLVGARVWQCGGRWQRWRRRCAQCGQYKVHGFANPRGGWQVAAREGPRRRAARRARPARSSRRSAPPGRSASSRAVRTSPASARRWAWSARRAHAGGRGPCRR